MPAFIDSMPTTIWPAGSSHHGHRRSELLRVELATDGQDGVADHFRLETANRETAEQAVLRVAAGRRYGGAQRLPVGGRSHDPSVQSLQAPAVVDEHLCQPIEQLGVRRPIALQPEVGGRGAEAAAEMMHPRPIDENPRDQRMRAVGQPVGIGQAAAGRQQRRIVGRDDGPIARLEYRQLVGRQLMFALLVIAARKRNVGGGLPGVSVIACTKPSFSIVARNFAASSAIFCTSAAAARS